MSDGKIRREDLFDDSALQAINEVAEGMQKLAESFKAALKDAQQLNKEITKSQSMKELNKQTVEATKLQNKLTLENKKFENQLKAAEIATRRTALAEERATVAKKKFDDAQVRATKNTNTWGKALGSFAAKFNTIGNVVGGALLKIGANILRTTKEFISFNKILEGSQALGDSFKESIGALKGGFEALNRAIASGNWADFFKNFREAAKAGRDYVKALDEIGDKENAILIDNAKNQRAVAELRVKIQEQSKYSLEERRQFAAEAIELEKKILKNNLDIANEKYKAMADANEKFSKLSIAEQEYFLSNYKDMSDKYGAMIKERAELVEQAEGKVMKVFEKGLTPGSMGTWVTKYAEGYDEAAKALKDFDEAAGNVSGYKEWIDLMERAGGLSDTQRKALSEAIANIENVSEASATGMRRIISNYEGLLKQEEKLIEHSKKNPIIDINKIEIDALELEDILDDLEETFTEFYDSLNEKSEMTFTEEIKFRQKWSDIMLKIKRKEVDEMEKMDDEALKNRIERNQQLIDLAYQSFDVRGMLIDNELQKVLNAKDLELKNAGDNAEKREQIERKYAGEVNKIKRKQAINDKLFGIFQVAINTAIAVSKALSNPALIPFIIALGGVQATAIAMQPIPEFWKGTQNAPEGPAWTGEHGRELLIDPYGGMQLTPDRPTLTYLKRGTKVIPAHKTKEMIESVQVARTPGSTGQNVTVMNDNKELLRAMRAKEQPIININSAGLTVMTRSASTLTKRIDKYFR